MYVYIDLVNIFISISQILLRWILNISSQTIQFWVFATVILVKPLLDLNVRVSILDKWPSINHLCTNVVTTFILDLFFVVEDITNLLFRKLRVRVLVVEMLWLHSRLGWVSLLCLHLIPIYVSEEWMSHNFKSSLWSCSQSSRWVPI